MSNPGVGEDFSVQSLVATMGLILALMFLAGMPAHLQAGSAHQPAKAVSAKASAKGGQYSLQGLIDYALAHNHEIAAGTFDGEAAVARTQAARGARLPRVSIEGGYTLYSEDLRLTAARYNGELGVFGDNIFTADLVLRLPLYAGGRLVAEMHATELLEASAGQRLARSRSDLVFNISSLYYSQLAQLQLIDSLRFSVDTLASQLDRVNALIAGRKAAKVQQFQI